jgi:ribosomal protein S30
MCRTHRSGKVRNQTPKVAPKDVAKQSSGRAKKRKAFRAATHDPINRGKEMYKVIERREYIQELKNDSERGIYINDEEVLENKRSSRNTKKPHQLFRGCRMYFEEY